MKKRKIVLLLILLVLIGLSLFFLFNLLSKPDIDYELLSYDDRSATVRISIIDKSILKRRYDVAVDGEAASDDGTVYELYDPDRIYVIEPGTWYIHVKDVMGKTADTGPIINSTLAIRVDGFEYPFYPVGEQLKLNYETLTFGNDEELRITSSDESVASVQDGKIITGSPGTATITVSSHGISDSVEIEVTDLYTLIDTDSMNKPILHETICDDEQNRKLDQVLEMKIAEAGYHTRAGVVAAARFMVLQFPYRLAYFAETGKLDNTVDSRRSDGEGRYYHKGFYLSEEKYEDIVASILGPKYWGQYFKEDTTEDHSRDEEYLDGGLVVSDIGTNLYLMKRPNGLDCGGFVSWCYYNAGYDFGDMGAGGPGSYGMSMLGERVSITDELLQSDRIRCGDLCGFTGHVGIVIGIEDDYIWIADTIRTGTKVRRYERNVGSFNELGDDAFTYFMLMDEEYLEDGNYTEMW
ncbi:MAG: Ig-like domain-containing protein [Erysipelotrichaceae bacterium]|nr:Ig-like domain-containing protein [Erysipelotrichaceae bacterium]